MNLEKLIFLKKKKRSLCILIIRDTPFKPAIHRAKFLILGEISKIDLHLRVIGGEKFENYGSRFHNGIG